MLGTGEIIVILCVTMILFGGKKLPEFAKHLGQGIREFKKACQGLDDEGIVNEHTPETPVKETIVVEAINDEKDGQS